MSYEPHEGIRRHGVCENGVRVTLWFPGKSRDAAPACGLPALFLHDGCKIFGLDEWKPGDAGVWTTVASLMNAAVIPEMVVVSLDYPEGETGEGIPLRSQMLSMERDGAEFQEWLVGGLLPVLEAEYALEGRSSARAICGTGLAALNTFHLALGDNPPAFSRYGCMSTSFEDLSMQIPARCETLLALEDGLRPHPGARIFLDYGTEGLDECYEPYHRELDALLRNHRDASGGEVRVVRVAGETHDAGSWRNRLAALLETLFCEN